MQIKNPYYVAPIFNQAASDKIAKWLAANPTVATLTVDDVRKTFPDLASEPDGHLLQILIDAEKMIAQQTDATLPAAPVPASSTWLNFIA